MSYAKKNLSEEQKIDIARTLFEVTDDNRPWLNGHNPFNTDSNPSFGYNYVDDYYNSFNSDDKGDLVKLYSEVNGLDNKEGFKAFCEEYGTDNYSPPRSGSKHSTNNSNANLDDLDDDSGDSNDTEDLDYELEMALDSMSYLDKIIKQLIKERGWNSNVLDRLQIRYCESRKPARIALPIRSADDDTLVNIRLYNTKADPKIMSYRKGLGDVQLFPNPQRWDKGDKDILICEGEPDTICALSRGYNATTFTGGCSTVPHHFLKHFTGMNVYIAYDADVPGQKGAKKLARALLKVAATVNLVNWPDFMGMDAKHGQDLTDYFAVHNGSEEEFEESFTEFSEADMLPLPLCRELPPAADFPTHVLPSVLKNAVKAISESIQAPEAISAQSLLAVSSLAVQTHFNVEIDGRISPTSNFFLTVAGSGDRKTAVDNVALYPVRATEEKLREELSAVTAKYTAEFAAWKKMYSDTVKNTAGDMAARTKALEELGPPPKKPLDAMLTTEEPTYEGLVKKLEFGQPSVGIFSDEAGRFMGGSAMSDQNLLKTIAGLSKMWDGSAITRTRVEGGSINLVGRRCSIHLMCQPEVSQQIFSNEMLSGQGFLSRCLVVRPASTIGTRTYSRINLKTSEAILEYNKILQDILSAQYDCKDGTNNELTPTTIKLTKQAKEVWITFHDDVEQKMRDGESYAVIRGFASKAPEHAARLACVMAIIDDSSSSSVKQVYVESAIVLINYYLQEAVRLFHSSAEMPELKLAEKTLKWLQENYKVFSLVQLYQKGPNAIRSQATAKKMVKILEDHNWIEELDGGVVIDGNRHRKAWKLVEV